MSSFLEQLTPDEKNLLQQTYEATQNGVQHDKLASIQEKILFNSGKLFAFVLAFHRVLEDNNIRCDSSEWNRLKKIAEDIESKPVGDEEA